MGAVSESLRTRGGATRLIVAERLCSNPDVLKKPVAAIGCRRALLACSGSISSDSLVCSALAATGLHPDAVHVVDLSTTVGTEVTDHLGQLSARVSSGLARIQQARLEVPPRTRADATTALLSRRSLFGTVDLPRRPVALASREASCGATCTACVSACRSGALSRTQNRVRVDESLCTGCGACTTACVEQTMTLQGASLAAIEAELNGLVRERLQLGSGIAITCGRAATSFPLGGSWDPLRVPSLEMVTAGWVLQIATSGAAVRLVPCREPSCQSRAAAITSFCSDVIERYVGVPGAGLTGSGESVLRLPTSFGVARPHPTICVREPAATARAMSRLAAAAARAADGGTAPGRCRLGASWTISSPLASLGRVSIDSDRCSGCLCCVRACPTGALSHAEDEDALSFIFDMSACPGCGSCGAVCPEQAVSMTRAASSSAHDGQAVVIARVQRDDRCASCGAPVTAGLASAVIARRLSGYPKVIERLSRQQFCADCDGGA